MPLYRAPVEDTLFLLRDVFHWDRYADLPAFREAPLDVVEAILREGGRLAEEVLQPINMSGDREGCRRTADGGVATPAGFREAYRAYADGGWVGLSADPEYGGQGLPYTLAALVNEYSASANMAFTMYPGLTQSAIAAIAEHASADLKRLYLPKMIAGAWTGTMNLTEPHCGTDLGLLRTRATPRPDGSWAITGQKIFISAGEHDLADNIVHLVLARMDGAPAGTRGISLLIVPKFIPDADGRPGLRNGVTCGAIEHKMGIHGNATCVMNYDGAQGWLIGEANRGLNAMFVMMNEARLGVANQGLAQSEVACQNAVAYARERLQGRALAGAQAPERPADPIIVHPDVRRMLLSIRAFNEAARALMIRVSLMADVARGSEDKTRVQEADSMLGLMTPVLKGVLTDMGFDNAVKAQQVFGGHGYVGEWGVEQFVRDARIAMIYEGANGIQALDLVARKLPRDGGWAIRNLIAEITGLVREHADSPGMKPYVAPLGVAVGHLQQATIWLMQNAMQKPDNAGAASYDYMHLLGLTALGHMWALMARAALAKKAADPSLARAMDAKLVVGRFFMERMLPETATHLARLTAGADTIMALAADDF